MAWFLRNFVGWAVVEAPGEEEARGEFAAGRYDFAEATTTNTHEITEKEAEYRRLNRVSLDNPQGWEWFEDWTKSTPQGWEWFEDWTKSTPDGPAECIDAGWRCGKCGFSLNDLGLYFDDPDAPPELTFCPNCGDKKR